MEYNHIPLSSHMDYQISRLPTNRMANGLTSSRSFVGSSSNLYRSQSMASLAGGERPVLGEGFRNSYAMRAHRTAVLKELGLNSKSMNKVPKQPRPTRTKDIFHAVLRGVRECIKEADLDYDQALEESQSKTTGSHALRVKSIERHKKKLEYLLSKVEELHDHYQVQNQMRDGTKALSKAYEQSVGHNKRSSLSNVQFGFKECTKMMCAIEAQLESMLGQFHCEMKGIMGFARVMPGDSFEVSIRHGNQKWKSKGQVSKDNDQTWDVNMKAFNISIHHSFTVKVFESKRLSRPSLGVKHCDILGLFAANPQILTVNVNDIGTIKLNLMVQWMPLANFSEKMSFYDPLPRDVSPRPLSVVFTSDTFAQPSYDQPLQTLTLDRPRKLKMKNMSPVADRPPDLLADMKEETRVDIRRLAEAIEEEEEADDDSFDWPTDLEKAVQKLREAVEDYQEHSSTLRELYTNVAELDDILGYDFVSPINTPEQPSRPITEPVRLTHHASSSSLAVEATIESAFDFLNEESCEEDSDTDTELGDSQQDSETSQEDEFDGTMSPISTARSTADSGIGSLFANAPNPTSTATNVPSSSRERTRCELRDSGRGESVERLYTTGNEDLDAVIIQHCVLCEILLEQLDNVGPLRYKERIATQVLKQQTKIMYKLKTIAKEHQSMAASEDIPINVRNVLQDIAPGYKLAHGFWLDNSKNKSILMSIPDFSQALYKSFNSTLQEQFEVKPEKVYNIILKRITHGSYFSGERQKSLMISAYQFMFTLAEGRCKSMEMYMQEIASEVWLIGQLKSGQIGPIKAAIESIHSTVPSLDAIKVLMVLSNTSKTDLAAKIFNYLHELAREKPTRDALIHYLLACLEETKVDVRIGACTCLEKIRATSAVEQLCYVAQADSSRKVQLAARKAASSLTSIVRSNSANQIKEV